MARVRTVEFLPEIFQTPVNRQFLNATLDQLTQEPAFQKTQGYVGRKIGPGVNASDRYVIEPTAERNNYQLEPGVISLDPGTSTIQDAITYPGINAALNLQGAKTNNADRLYTSEYYTWDPFVDFDKFVNYSQYYWLPAGPDAVDVFSTGVPLTDTFVVTRANGVYTFSGVAGNNPVITLARGGNYNFEVAQNDKSDINFSVTNNGNTAYVIDFQPNPNLTLVRGNTYTFTLSLTGLYPFYIKTEPTLGTTNQYNTGVTNNGSSTGTITFTVPQNAPDTLYYVNPTQPSMQGTFTVINGTPGTGPGFWIQTDPGVNGRIPATPNISSRDVLGVTNNGEDLGTVTFDVPFSTAQDFFYNLPFIGNIPGKPTGTVDLITTLKFNEINNQFVDTFLLNNPSGIDGINSATALDGKTLVFLNQETDAEAGGWQVTTQYDPLPNVGNVVSGTGSYDSTLYDQTTDIINQSERYSVWQIQYVPTEGGGNYMRLVLLESINNLEKFSVLFGTQYSSTQWYKNSSGYFQRIPLLTAVRNVLFYQDGTDPDIFGQIRIIDQQNADTIDIADILGQKNYTSPNGVKFTNGLKVVFRGSVTPSSYQNQEYYVEGVGIAIKLLPVGNFITPETYTESASVPYDSTPYDVGNYDATENAPLTPDYLTINRAAQDLNAWTRSNRWFHIDVIRETAEYNNTEATPDNRLRARRPILEFRAGTRLFDFGTQGKQPVNIIDFEQTDALSNINGSTGYSVDGYTFVSGSRVIFAADQDSQVRNKIYEVTFITPDTVAPLIAQPVINLVPATDAQVLPDQCTVCLSGSTLQGKSFWFDGVEWLSAQDKISVNQAPLFNVYDADGVSFSNQEKYLSSNFAGSKLFSYATSNLSPDAVLGFPVRYLSLANVGDIVFENNLYSDSFSYVVNGQGSTKFISEGFVRQYSSRVSFAREIGWQTAATRSLQRQQFQFSYDGSPLLLDVRVNDDQTVPAIQLYVNSAFQEPGSYSYTRTSNTTIITLNKVFVPGDVVEVAVLSDQISNQAFYQIPINLENNPLNGNSETFTLGTIRSHYQTIGENLLNIQGPIIGANNSRDLGNIIPYGLQILQQSSPLTLAGYFMRNTQYDIFSAIEYNSREYIKFKSLLMETVISNEYALGTPVSQILDSAIYEITKGRTNINPFYWSDMLPTGAVFTQTQTLITPITTNTFNTQQTYDYSSANYLGLLVYVSRILPNQTTQETLLTRGTDYVVDPNAPRLTINVPLAIGETVVIREYSNTAGNFVPNTPTKLGLYPKYRPQQFVDTNYVEPTPVIQGHDGSITVAFNDIRDEVLLEFERRIYNNLKTDGNPVPLTAEDVIPGFFRTTDYSQTEINDILDESFLTWVGWNKLDYTTQDYNPNNAFTYNYSASGNKINGEPLLGAWRGIYKYFYDTTSPNLTPWEMLGFSEKPIWWDTRYGPAPYTSDNLVLWDDLELGLVADPVAPYVLPQYARPGLTQVIPVGSEGQLLAPIDSVVGAYDPTAFRKSWVPGDGGPVQNTWWTSSSYPFAIMRLLALTRPAEFFTLFADRDLYRYSTELEQYLYAGRYRLTTTTNLVNQPIDSTLEIYGNGVSKASYIDWIVDYNQQLGRNSTTALSDDLSYVDVRLCYRMATFTDKQYLKVFVERSSPNSTNSSLLLPDDSFALFLYKNQPFERIVYSSLVVERTSDGYSVWGYNNATPYFNILASSSNGLLQTVSGGGAEVRVPAQYTNNVVKIPYGYTFTNTTMVVDFILSYGKYLETQGLIFDDRENGYTLNWNQMATEFLYFSQQGWAPGTLINLNPAATTIKAVKAEAVVDTIVSTSPENLILNQNKQTLPTRDLIINRETNEFSITSANNQAISFLNMKFTNYEDIMILNNVSVFNDLIYDSITGARQSRVRITAAVTSDWNGTLDAQGFILNNNRNVEPWRPNRKYTKGEIVLYKNNYWSAQTIVQPKLEFNYDDWVKSDYTRIQGGLLPNIANKADQLANSYNTQVANLERDNDLFSYGLIGFRPRQYMVDLNLDDVSQVNLYQQFLPTKGTTRAAEIFTNADLGKESGEYSIYENWGVLVSTYGANANRSFIELRLNEADLTADPCTVQVITPAQSSLANQSILLGDVWRESYKLTSTNIFPTTLTTNPDTALPSAGYVNLDDIDITVFSLDDPTSLDINIDTIGIGTTIWAAKSNSYDWNVYRCNRVSGQLTQIIDNLNGTSIAQFDQVHGLSRGDLIIIRYFNSAVDGVYRVLSVPSINSVTIAYSFVNTNQTTITGTGLVFYLQTMRVAQASDVANLPYANSLIPGELAYVDNDGTGHWEVLQKQNTFSLASELFLDPLESDSGFGASVAQSLDLNSVLVGAPNVNSGAGKVYPYGTADVASGYTPAGELSLNATAVVGFGDVVTYGGNQWSAVGAPRSASNFGYVTCLYKNPVSSAYSITQLLNRPSPSIDNVQFGQSVVISQDERWMYIGAPNDTNGGKVYCYGRVDVESQSVLYGTDGLTTNFNWSNSIVVDLTNRAKQLIVTLGDTVQVEGVDYTVSTTEIVFGTAPAPGFTLTIRRRNSVSFTGDGSTENFPLDPWLYTANNIDSFTVRLNGIVQRPYIDYEFNSDSTTFLYDLIFTTAPNIADLIEVNSNTYWKLSGTVNPTGFDTLPATAEFGISLATSTDGRQLIIGADRANSSQTASGAVYVYDRSVIRYLVTNSSQVSYAIPGTPAGPVAVLLNGEFLTVRNITDGGVTTTQYINGQVDVNFDASEITLQSSVSLTVGDNIEIETNQFQPVQKVTAETPAPNTRFGQALDICSTNCSLYVGAPQDSSVLIEAGKVERNTNQSRLYGVIASTIANPSLTAGDTFRINNIVVTVPAVPNNTIQGVVTAIVAANIPNATATSTPNLILNGDGSTQTFDIGNIYSDAASYTTVVYVDNVLKTSGVDYTYNPTTKQINFTVAPTANSTILVVSGRLVISVVNSAAAIPGNKLSVLPGVTNSAFLDIGFDTFVYAQTINSPNPVAYAKFGSSVSVDTGAVNLVVGAPNGNIYEPMTFDGGATRFDDRSTTFFNPVINSGVAYTYDFLPSANASVANPGQFVFGQQVYDNNILSFDQFGQALNYTNGQLLVGAVGYDAGIINSNYGLVSIFSNPNNSPSWAVIHRQQPVVDVNLINTVFMYDRLTSATQTYFDFIDPLQGKILGAARRNLDYIGAVDPASYNSGSVRNQGTGWGAEHVGEMWWDTDTVRFINPNQDDIVYASRRWAQIFPGSRVDVYQWIESSVPPVSYTGPGVPLSTTSYTVKSSLNNENIFVTSYFFWVRGITTIATNSGKTLSTTGVANYIASPRTSGIPYVALLNSSTVAIYNGLEFISAADTILHVGYDRELTDANIHTEYQFVADGLADSFLNASLYRKLQDSFCGIDTAGARVPDPTLSPAERYGVQFRPRQSMFADRFLALQNYLTRANNVLKLYPVVETKNLALLNSSEPQPSALSSPASVSITIASPAVVTWPDQDAIAGNTPVVFSSSGSLPAGITAGTVYFVRNFVSSNSFTISATLGGPAINTSGTQSGQQSGAVVQWNKRVSTIEELGWQDLNAVPLGYLYLVESDVTQSGYWDIYQVIESDVLVGTRTVRLFRIQNYFTPKYWYHIDWYQPGYNRDTQPIAEVPVPTALSTLNIAAAPVGSSVKVTANAQGKFEIYVRIDATQSGWERVALQDGTLQFREELWNYNLGGFGFDVEPFDTKGFGFDIEPVLETRKIIQAINEQLFVDDLAIERNRSLILMFNFIYSEFTAPEWLIKTSLIDVQHNIRALRPFQTFLQDNQTFVLDYIQEVKPYHVQIREFNLSYDGQDIYDGLMTDFDVPAYWKTDNIAIPQYVSPVLQFNQDGLPYTASGSLVENFVSDAAPDEEIWVENPWSQWYNNYLLDLVSVTVINGGSGYTVAPQVEITGTCVQEPVLEAVINSAGQVVAVIIVDAGLGFSTNCVISFVGGNGSGAQAVAELGNTLVRNIKTVIKYDRCEYTSQIVDWEANVSYDNGTLVRYLNRVWSANSGDSTPVSGAVFDPAQWILVTANTLSASDRTMGYYTPTVNMPGLSLPLLISGIEYPGVQVSAPSFDQNTGYDIGNYDINPWDNIFISPEGFPTYDLGILDAIYASYYPRPPEFPLPVPTGTGATDLNVEGGAYVDTYSSHAPEELIPGAEFDTLDLRVYTRPGSDWEVDGHGFPLKIVNHIVSSVPAVLSWTNTVSVPTSVVVSNQTLGIVLDLGVDYTIDWIEKTVTIITDAAIGDTISIAVYGLGGGNQLFQNTYTGDEVGNSLAVDILYSDIQEFAIFVNGTLTTDYTYETLWQQPGITTAYESEGSSGTTLVVASTQGISAGSLIVGTGFISGQTVVEKFNETVLIISAPPDSTPSGSLTFEANTGQTLITFGNTYDATDFLSVTAIGPTIQGSTTIDYGWSTAVVQTIISPGSVLSFLLDNSLEYTNPDNLIVNVNGSRARTSAGAEWYGDGSTAYELPTRLGFSQALIADADVHVYVDDILQTLGVDYVIEPYTAGDNRAVEFLTAPPLDSRILICVVTGSQCYVSGGQLIFDPAGGLVPVAGSVIEVITWNDTRQQNLLTKVFVGPVTVGITVNEPYDSTDYDTGTVSGSAGSYDYTAGVIISVNDFQLGRPITDLDRLWVTLNGTRLFPEVDFTVSGEELILNSGVIHSLDTLMVTECSNSVVPANMAFRIFQDMRGLQTTYRITPETTTTLTTALTADADIIYVYDASTLSLPVLENNQWGVLTIDGERIMYRERDLINNTVSSLIRGTAGTSATSHDSGAVVYNMSTVNKLPAEYENYIVSNLTNDTETYPVLGDGSSLIFVAEDIDNITNTDSIEVYLGGIRQFAGYNVTGTSPVTVQFVEAPPSGVQVTILVRRGTWWYDVATSAEREQSMQVTANPAARFLRGQ